MGLSVIPGAAGSFVYLFKALPTFLLAYCKPGLFVFVLGENLLTPLRPFLQCLVRVRWPHWHGADAEQQGDEGQAVLGNHSLSRVLCEALVHSEHHPGFLQYPRRP